MARFLPILTVLVLFGLFTISIIFGGAQLAALNNPNQTITKDSAVAAVVEELNTTIGNFGDAAESSVDAISEPGVFGFVEKIIVNSIAGVWKVLKAAPTTIYNIVSGLLASKIFSGPFIIVLGVVGSLLTVGVVIAVIRLIITGEGD